jgi:enoyl-CoA hydratase/carnithine racemase
MITYEKQGKVALVTMNNGANRHNLEFATALLNTLVEVEADKDVKALVLHSSDEKSWSQGIDVNWLMGSIQSQQHDDVKKFMHTMDKIHITLMEYPVPTIAAINGHTFGNGCILACACDFRFMRSDRGYFCFPEVDLSIPFLPGLISIAKKAIPHYRFNEMKLTGRRVGSKELEADHIIEKSLPNAEELLAESLAFAKTFNKSRLIFKEHKVRLNKPVVDDIRAFNPPLIDNMKLLM